MKVTFNQFILANTSQALIEYAARHPYNDQDLDSLVFGSSFSLRDFPKSDEDVCIKNEVVALLYSFKLDKTFEGAIESVRELKKNFGGILELYSMHFAYKVISELPFGLQSPVLDLYSESISLFYSNMPMPVNGFVWNGVHVKQAAVFVEALGKAASILLVSSMSDSVNFALTTCQKQIKHPDELMQILEKLLVQNVDQKSKEDKNQ